MVRVAVLPLLSLAIFVIQSALKLGFLETVTIWVLWVCSCIWCKKNFSHLNNDLYLGKFGICFEKLLMAQLSVMICMYVTVTESIQCAFTKKLLKTRKIHQAFCIFWSWMFEKYLPLSMSSSSCSVTLWYFWTPPETCLFLSSLSDLLTPPLSLFIHYSHTLSLSLSHTHTHTHKHTWYMHTYIHTYIHRVSGCGREEYDSWYSVTFNFCA